MRSCGPKKSQVPGLWSASRLSAAAVNKESQGCEPASERPHLVALETRPPGIPSVKRLLIRALNPTFEAGMRGKTNLKTCMDGAALERPPMALITPAVSRGRGSR